MPYKRDPAEEAAKYQVLKFGEDEYELKSDSCAHRLHRTLAKLRFEGKPLALRWHSNEGEEAYYSASLSVAKLNIGYQMDEGWFSELTDDHLFVVDGDKIRHVPLKLLRVISAQQFEKEKRLLTVLRRWQNSDSEEEGLSGAEHTPLYHAKITHLSAGNDETEFLECTIGLPQTEFVKLVEGCISRNIKNFYFQTSGVGLSSSFEFGDARDLILLADSKIDLFGSSFTIDYQSPIGVAVDAGNQREPQPRLEAARDQCRLPSEEVKEIQAMRLQVIELNKQMRRLAKIIILGIVVCGALIIIQH